MPGDGTGPTIVGGDGAYLLTADGRRILDARRRRDRRQHRVGPHRGRRRGAPRRWRAAATSIPLWPTPNRLALRDRLVERWLPDGFTQVFFTSGGSECTDSALRLARAYQVGKGRPGRWKVIGRHPSYHGMTLGTMAAASHSIRQAGYEPLLLPFPKVPWNDPEAVVKVIEQEDPDTIAGFIAEPITGAAGACLVASDEYWRTVTEVCREHDILLIADEVMTGFGRTGATVGPRALPVRAGRHRRRQGPRRRLRADRRWSPPAPTSPRRCATRASCSSRSPAPTAMCAGADVVLEILEREALVERAAQRWASSSTRACTTSSTTTRTSTEVRGKGLFAGVELVRDRDGAVQFPADARFAGDGRGRGAAPRRVGVPGRIGTGARRRDARPAVRHDRGRHRHDRSRCCASRSTKPRPRPASATRQQVGQSRRAAIGCGGGGPT